MVKGTAHSKVWAVFLFLLSTAQLIEVKGFIRRFSEPPCERFVWFFAPVKSRD